MGVGIGAPPIKTAGLPGHWTPPGPQALPSGMPHRHPASVHRPPQSPWGSQDRFSFSPRRQPVGGLGASFYFFFRMIISPLFFVAKNHPGLSRREGRKLCREREGKIISPGHRRSHLSSACSGKSREGMKMKAGPDPSLSSSALPGGDRPGEGRRQGRGLWALIKGLGEGGRLHSACPSWTGPLPHLRPQFPH